MNRLHACKIVLFFAFSFFAAHAASYYVDPANGSMNNDGSAEHPWSTLKAVLLTRPMADGDTLFLRDGFHGENITIGGSHSTPVVIVAEKEQRPQLFNVSLSGSGWILDGLVFTPEGVETRLQKFLLKVAASARNNIIQHCSFYSVQEAAAWTLQDWRGMVWDGVHVYGAGNIIRRNHFRNIRFALQFESGAMHSLVEYNTVEFFCGDGIRVIGADSCIVQYNVIRNSVELDANPSDGNHEDGFQAWAGVEALQLRGNYILNFSDPGQPFRGLLQGIGCFDGPYNDWLVENNVVVVEHWHGISLYEAHNSTIINNTVLPNPGSASAGPPWIGIFPNKSGRPGSNNLVRNNLATQLNLENGTANDHNFIGGMAVKYVNNFDSLDFRPRPAMPPFNGLVVIDGGNADQAPAIDITGASRPWGAGIDIGAYEYDGSYGDDGGYGGWLYAEDFDAPFEDEAFWAYNWSSAGEIVGRWEDGAFRYDLNNSMNYYLGVVLKFKDFKNKPLNMQQAPYIRFKAKAAPGATLGGEVVSDITIGCDLVHNQKTIGYAYFQESIPADGEWHEVYYDFSSIQDADDIREVDLIRFHPGHYRGDSGAAFSGTVWIDDFKIGKSDVNVSVAEKPSPPDFSLRQNYPNPFNPTTTISYRLQRAGLTELTVFDARGRIVQMLVHEWRAAGVYETVFQGAAFPSGVYFYRLKVGDRVRIRRMLLLK